MQLISSHSRKQFLTAMIGITSVLVVTGCGSSERPLAIRMYHPTSNQTLHCTARAQPGSDSTLLADVVEACARQLEASGFVREK